MGPMLVVPEQDYAAPVLITLGYFLLGEIFIAQQAAAKVAAGVLAGRRLDRFDYSDRRCGGECTIPDSSLRPSAPAPTPFVCGSCADGWP